MEEHKPRLTDETYPLYITRDATRPSVRRRRTQPAGGLMAQNGLAVSVCYTRGPSRRLITHARRSSCPAYRTSASLLTVCFRWFNGRRVFWEASEKRPGSLTTDRRSNSAIIRAAGTIVSRSLLSVHADSVLRFSAIE